MKNGRMINGILVTEGPDERDKKITELEKENTRKN
jgi:hypothetical protein